MSFREELNILWLLCGWFTVWLITSFPGPKFCCCCYFSSHQFNQFLWFDQFIFCDSGEALENKTFLPKKKKRESGRRHGMGGWAWGRHHRVLLGYRFSPTGQPPPTPPPQTPTTSAGCHLGFGLTSYISEVRMNTSSGFGQLMRRVSSLEKTLVLEKLEGRRRRGWMASLTQWTWVWANSRKHWRTGRPGVL